MVKQSVTTDVLIIGAGAAGLMCAKTAAGRGKKVLLVDHARKAGQKILMSGGGHCNFTNYDIQPENYLCHNPHFCKSALKQYSQWDFIALLEAHGIDYHEKKPGQLFCVDKAKVIVALLLDECAKAGVRIETKCSVEQVQKANDGFIVKATIGKVKTRSLVVASGGLSIPTMGASPFGYQLAGQFGLKVYLQQPALVPFTFNPAFLQRYATLSGQSLKARVRCRQQFFEDFVLFTHRGLSGPAILQISSYWQPGDKIELDLLPTIDLLAELLQQKAKKPQQKLKNVLRNWFGKKMLDCFLADWKLDFADKALAQIAQKDLQALAYQFHHWELKPSATEGYRTAEVTLGGVDSNELSSKTMESHKVKGLYFIGEVVDVTGHLGGYNFQWAWSSGYVAGMNV